MKFRVSCQKGALHSQVHANKGPWVDENNKKIVVKKENKHNENKFQFITQQRVMMLRVARLPESPIKSSFTELHCPRCWVEKHFHLEAIKPNVKQLRQSYC